MNAEISDIESNLPGFEASKETLLGDLMGVALQEIKAIPEPWQKLGQSQQEEVIYRVERACRKAIGQAALILAAGGREHVQAQVDQVVFKDGAKVVLTGHGQPFHSIADNVGRFVVIVIPEEEPSLQAGHDHKAEKDQKDLLEDEPA